ncbi:prolipoprotein diacylglyceryl transferase [Paucibacter sp. O1-1]|nr:prolipoprotein diacylglyceryl transferase [Paucibacter sp. O1-1]MDA3824371.1 prolipoprotein diacylglyceryl transferase [Paucibacter sp. O1-1]
MEHIVWDFDPILVSFMGLTVHWYGALFALAIATGFQVMKRIYTKEGLDVESLDNLLVYCVVGIIVGARLAHCVFYDPGYYFANPLKILAIWEGGLASHGGGLGAILALYYYQRQVKLPFLFLLDRLAIATAIFGFFCAYG